MKILITNSLFAVGPEPIDRSAVARLRHGYIRQFGHAPDQLKLSPDAYNVLWSQAAQIPGREVFMGMNMELRHDFEPGEWRVGRSEETMYEKPDK